MNRSRGLRGHSVGCCVSMDTRIKEEGADAEYGPVQGPTRVQRMMLMGSRSGRCFMGPLISGHCKKGVLGKGQGVNDIWEYCQPLRVLCRSSCAGARLVFYGRETVLRVIGPLKCIFHYFAQNIIGRNHSSNWMIE